MSQSNTPSIHPCTQSDTDYIYSKLLEYNLHYITDYEDLCYNIKDDDGSIIAGIVATRLHQFLTIKYLWVDGLHRGKGHGGQLLRHIEAEAIQKGVNSIYVNTFGFQAPEFYPKMGYERFGAVENCINGYGQYFYKKIIKE